MLFIKVRELTPEARGRQDAGSRNLSPAPEAVSMIILFQHFNAKFVK